MRDLIRLFVAAFVTGLVGGIGASFVAHVIGHPVRPWLACSLTVSAALLLAALYEASLRVIGSEPPAAVRPERGQLTDRKRGGLDVTVRLIERATSDPDRYEVLRTRLMRLTAERLLTRRGVDVRSEPQQARALVGDDLVDLFTERPSRPPNSAQLERWMTRLEGL